MRKQLDTPRSRARRARLDLPRLKREALRDLFIVTLSMLVLSSALLGGKGPSATAASGARRQREARIIQPVRGPEEMPSRAAAPPRSAMGRTPSPSHSKTRQAPSKPSPRAHHIKIKARRPRPGGQPGWYRRMSSLASRGNISVSAQVGGRWLFHARGKHGRIPASNQKLLLSMALLNSVSGGARIPTRAVTGARVVNHTVRGNLWVVGRGDPEGSRTTMARLAASVAKRGIKRITGAVVADIGAFKRERVAHGWAPYYPYTTIPPATGLTWYENWNGSGVMRPESSASAWLKRELNARGIWVGGRSSWGRQPKGLKTRVVGETFSRPLHTLMSEMDVHSINFYAEQLGRFLGGRTYGFPGSMTKTADAIRSYAAARGVQTKTYDSCGLSVFNRITTDNMVRLLTDAMGRKWWPSLTSALARPGIGTLWYRLGGVNVRAKTGTLNGVSALSGWVWLKQSHRWAAFSIMSYGMSKSASVALEDEMVRTLAEGAVGPPKSRHHHGASRDHRNNHRPKPPKRPR